ncbi:MAG: inner rane transporter RhtA [Baekduia sp.]|jgi:inner membrane transporter RhtA|nr:inner rane transporter RhtA [Baekduia sp.]
MEAVARTQWDTRGRLGDRRRRFRLARAQSSTRLAYRFGGPVLIIASSASLQTSAALATSIFAVYGPAGTGALRFAFAAPVLLLLARPTLRGRSPRFWVSAVIFGAALAAMNFVLYEAIARVSLGTVVTLQFLGPLTLGLLAVRRRLDALWVAAAAGGVLSLTGGPSGAATTGVALALVAAALTALSLLMAHRLASESSGLDGLALAVGIAACITLPLAIPAALATRGPRDLALVAAVAALGIGLPYILEYVAIKAVSVKTFSVLLSLDPAIALLAGALLLGQTLAPAEMLGVGLVIVASAGVMATQRAT